MYTYFARKMRDYLDDIASERGVFRGADRVRAALELSAIRPAEAPWESNVVLEINNLLLAEAEEGYRGGIQVRPQPEVVAWIERVMLGEPSTPPTSKPRI